MLRKIFFTISILVVAIGVMAFVPPSDYMQQSTAKTADAQILTGGGYFYGIMAALDGTNDVTFKLYDNTSGTGTVFAPDVICTTTADSRTCAFGFDPPLPVNTGIYIDITTSGTVSYVAYYRSQ
jgi:hypothetical protein